MENEERKVGNLEERILLEYLLVFIYRNPPHRSVVVNNDWDVIACNSKNPKDVERVRMTKKLQQRWRQTVGRGDTAFYTTQNDGSDVIANNDWNAAHDSYI